MAMNQKKKIIKIVTSCANCPFGKFNPWDSDHYPEKYQLWCRKLHQTIKPSKHEPMADYYHNIPEECPFPDADEEEVKKYDTM